MNRLALAFLLLAAPASAALRHKELVYKDGDVTLKGYAAWDDAHKGKRPGVLVVHEWWGYGPYVKKRADMLAKLGYVAFAADMYGEGVYAKNHEEAGKLSGAMGSDRAAMRRRATAGLEQLKALPQADASKLAAMGYCFGGTTVLELARMGADLRGVASFHGGLGTPAPATEKPKARVLVLQGGDDKFTLADLPAFEDEMRKVGADWELDEYSGAVHSFTVPDAGDNPSTGMAYDKEADERSWTRLTVFLRELFR